LEVAAFLDESRRLIDVAAAGTGDTKAVLAEMEAVVVHCMGVAAAVRTDHAESWAGPGQPKPGQPTKLCQRAQVYLASVPVAEVADETAVVEAATSCKAVAVVVPAGDTGSANCCMEVAVDTVEDSPN